MATQTSEALDYLRMSDNLMTLANRLDDAHDAQFEHRAADVLASLAAIRDAIDVISPPEPEHDFTAELPY